MSNRIPSSSINLGFPLKQSLLWEVPKREMEEALSRFPLETRYQLFRSLGMDLQPTLADVFFAATKMNRTKDLITPALAPESKKTHANNCAPAPAAAPPKERPKQHPAAKKRPRRH